MAEELEVKPNLLSSSINRILEHLMKSNKTYDVSANGSLQEKRSLPHTFLAMGIGLAVGAIPFSLIFFGILSIPDMGFGLGIGQTTYSLAILTFAGIVIPVSFLAQVFFLVQEMKNRKYVIRAEGVDIVDDYLDRNTTSASYENITDVKMKKPVLQRIFGTGNVILNTSGSGNMAELKLEYVDNPETLQDELSDIISSTEYRQEV